MAPINRVDHDAVEQQLKDIIQDLYQVMVQVSTYDSMGRPSRDVLSNEFKTVSRSLQTLHASASPPHALPSVPPELLEYVENGRNPDIYTREFVELVRRGNQLMRGKMHAFGSYRDILAQNIATAMPELRDDVARVLESTGGNRSVLSSLSSAPSSNTGAGLGSGAGSGINGTLGTMTTPMTNGVIVTPAPSVTACATAPTSTTTAASANMTARDATPSTS